MTAFANQSHQQQSLTGWDVGGAWNCAAVKKGDVRAGTMSHTFLLCFAELMRQMRALRRGCAVQGKKGRVHPALSLHLSVGFMSSDQLFWPAAVQTLKARLVFQPKKKA